jgi:hypothetical protein
MELNWTEEELQHIPSAESLIATQKQVRKQRILLSLEPFFSQSNRGLLSSGESLRFRPPADLIEDVAQLLQVRGYEVQLEEKAFDPELIILIATTK